MIESNDTRGDTRSKAAVFPGEFAEITGKTGAAYWKSLEELAGTERFKDFIQREYPSQAERLFEAPERRTVLKLMGASLALAGFNSCTRQPEEKIVPFAKNPEYLIPGEPLYFATAMPWSTGAIGVLAESHMGRPTKVEGNERHAASLGATDSFTQASVLDLYDPDRSMNVLARGRISTWDEFLAALREQVNVQSQRQGVGLRILSTTITSPTLAQQAQDIQALYPQAKWTQYEPVNRDNSRDGTQVALGQDASIHARFDKAKVVVSFESNFLGGGPESVRATREFIGQRKVRAGTTSMNRLYVVESAATITGAMADHRLALRSVDVGHVARLVAKQLGIDVSVRGDMSPATMAHVDAITKDLQSNAGASLVLAGETQTPFVHALVHAINQKLGNVGQTVVHLPPVETLPQATGQVAGLRALVDEMNFGRVEMIVILGGNPVYDAPADIDFKAALARVPFRARVSSHEDETSALCDWQVPEAHYLESWSDARAFDGTVSIVQPLIAPLFAGKTWHEVAAAIAGTPGQSPHDIVRAYWQKLRPDDFEKSWRRWLHDGIVPGTTATALTIEPKPFKNETIVSIPGMEVVFRPDPTLWDGRFANNGWLQENPKPLTKVTWDNTIHLSPTTAASMKIQVGDVVELTLAGRKVRGPVWVMPGHADDCATVYFGSGRTRAGHVGNGTGFDAYPLRAMPSMWTAYGLDVRKTGETMQLASTQEHEDYELVQTELEKRKILRVRTLDDFKADPHSLSKEDREEEGHEARGQSLSMYHVPVQGELERGQRQKGDHAWGMVIDLNACTACGACVTACVAENNIPVVGKDQVLRGREMHWIRIDRYFAGPKENPRFHSQPLPCQQCENAPCETVCPVGATTHSPEGLNEMTYNRCVGTRYCSNNCPYKVRRFNFLLYSDYATETLKLQRNPDVSVRSRGVMEKCTYCVQRISLARIKAKREDRKIAPGEVVTACQQVCPAEAITFGDIQDKSSAVAKLKTEPHNYSLIEELQTIPRTTYLAKVWNPNPKLESEHKKA